MATNTFDQEMNNLDYGKLMSKKAIRTVDREMQFTRTYMYHQDKHPYLREAECLRVQTRLIMMPMRDGDWFAGKLDRMFAGIDPERGDLQDAAYFCSFDLLAEQLSDPAVSREVKEDIEFLISFWKKHATYFKCRNAYPEKIKAGMPSDDYTKNMQISFPMYGLGGPSLDYEKLVRQGIPGLRSLVSERKEKAMHDGETDLAFYSGMETALDIFCEMAARYAEEAVSKARQTQDPVLIKKYKLIAESLNHLKTKAPETYHQSIQLMWLYNLMALPRNYGRMDNYLGDFLVNDLSTGRLTRDEALDMTVGLWRQIVERGDNFNNRILIGGKGRHNEKNADVFAMFALEAQKIVNEAIPQLSVRWYDGMNRDIWDKAFEVLATGSTMPIIYNDDVLIPGMKKALGVSYEEAEDYAFYGCGEFLIDHRSVASPDAAINILKCLDVTLRNGIEPVTAELQGLELGSLSDYSTFEDLFAVFSKQVEHQLEMLAEAQDIIYRETGKEAAFPFLSMLYDDCIERGKPLLAGGVRYLGGTVESFGNNTTGDALLAIKKLVFDSKLISAERMLECLDKNFEGCEKEWKLMRSVAKYGNDDTEADAMAVRVNDLVAEASRKQKEKTELDSFLLVLVNNGDSVRFGKSSAASADGRKKTEPVSNGNQPSSGNDISGITALLNSMSKLKADRHAGATHNVKFSRDTLLKNSAQVKALIKGYFSRGGSQVMITSADKGELERAMAEPAKYRHLFVRVGGYSERFVNLPVEVQREVINRTLY